VSTCSENLSRKQAILMRNTSTPWEIVEIFCIT
jgi:hypothetical protein